MSITRKQDILKQLRKMFDAVFMSKSWNPVIANENGIELTLVDLLPLIRRSVRLRLAMEMINRVKGTPMLEMHSTVITYLEEMGHYRSMRMIRWVGLLLCHIIKRNYSGIIVDEESIENVKAIMGSNPVIFAPSHKSYADFILMSFLCFYYDIEIPVIAAGQDFQSMWVMGRVLRECCAFFMRRSFGDDHLYKTVIAEYVSLLMTFGHSALEFFIEGTRSRSGKSLLPKFGLMTMALEPYFFGKVPDITIVPVSITYERCLEDSLFAREVLGVPKPKESTMLLLRALQVLKENYGRIFVEFGEPISVKKFCARDLENIDPRIDINQASSFYSEPQYPGPRVARCVKDLCYTVVQNQNRHLTFTPFHMMAASLSAWIIFENKVPIDKILFDMEYLKNVLVVLGYTTILKDLLDDLFDNVKLHERVVYHCNEEKVVKLRLGLASTSTMYDNVLQGPKLSERTLTEAYPIVIIQHYANPVCLACIHVSILTFLLCAAGKKIEGYNRNEDALYRDYSFFRSLFQVEFVLQEDEVIRMMDYTSAIHHMCTLGMFFTSSQEKTVNLDNAENLRNPDKEAILLGLLHPFLSGYMLIVNILIVMGYDNIECSEKELRFQLQKSLEVHLHGAFKFQIPKYIFSLDLITNALLALSRMGAIQRCPTANVVMVRPDINTLKAYAEEIEDRLARLRCQMSGCYERVRLTHFKKYKLYTSCKL